MPGTTTTLTPLPETTAVGWRLLDAAADLFYTGGINATGTDALVDRAQTTKRTMYQRFGSKDNLVCAYLTVRAHRWQTLVLAALDTPDAHPATVTEQLEKLFACAAEWASHNPRGCAFVNAWAEIGDSSPEAADVIRAEKHWMLRLFRRIVDDPGMAAEIHGIYEGALVHSTILSDPQAFDRALRTSLTVAGQR